MDTIKEKLDLLDRKFEDFYSDCSAYITDKRMREEITKNKDILKESVLKSLWYFYFFFFKWNYDKEKNKIILGKRNNNGLLVCGQNYLKDDFDITIPIDLYISQKDELLKFSENEIDERIGQNYAKSNIFIGWVNGFYDKFKKTEGYNWNDLSGDELSDRVMFGRNLYNEFRKIEDKMIRPTDLEDIIKLIKDTKNKEYIDWTFKFIVNGDFEKYLMNIKGKRKITNNEIFEFLSRLVERKITAGGIKQRYYT
ncbi:MAG TPA: hypothetical protein VIL99_02155 [Ignavibacteria bacterium]